MRKLVLLTLCFLQQFLFAKELLVETELFQDKGGWIVESQFVNQMGSPYLLAHGLGRPVADAKTKVTIEKGCYHVWVRTKDWAPFPQGPGKFNVSVGGYVLPVEFGSSGTVGWHWEYGGTINIIEKEVELLLHDLTGFEGRCDAIFFSENKDVCLPTDLSEWKEYRKKFWPSADCTIDEGMFDFVVVGGGVAGICAAVQAARLGIKVALINNRPVLGGNNSSEYRIPMDGDVFRNKYPTLGRIVREVDGNKLDIKDSISYRYRDEWKKRVVQNERNIHLFENMHVVGAVVKNGKICSIEALNLNTLKMHSFQARFFADCTGDADLGRLAGADCRYGRECRSETGERWAPERADELVMGSSCHWYAQLSKDISEFQEQPWMLLFSDEYHFDLFQSRFNWETGFNSFHTVNDAEEIRDHNFRAIYGNWAYLKTHKSEEYGKYKLAYLANFAGKRESYRLMGDVVLCQQDIEQKVEYPDAIVTTTWGIDLHYPDDVNLRHFPDEGFLSYAIHPLKQKDVYTFPYRCLYSRNIDNLFMAGRNISVTHVALGAIRVQRCTGMMGEVVGLAAFICCKNDCTPRNIYTHYWDEMEKMIKVEFK